MEHSRNALATSLTSSLSWKTSSCRLQKASELSPGGLLKYRTSSSVSAVNHSLRFSVSNSPMSISLSSSPTAISFVLSRTKRIYQQEGSKHKKYFKFPARLDIWTTSQHWWSGKGISRASYYIIFSVLNIIETNLLSKRETPLSLSWSLALACKTTPGSWSFRVNLNLSNVLLADPALLLPVEADSPSFTLPTQTGSCS